ncbi:MAG: NADPH:quinone reductase [Burkholderiales bacterium]
MRAAIYEKTGPAHEVLKVVDVETPHPGPGEVRVKIQWSGVNPSDVKSRAGLRTKTLAFPRIIPHSDGSGVIDEVGADVPDERVGEKVWIWNAAWQRPFGSAAEYVVLPSRQAVRLPEGTSPEAGACIGIPALTAYHAVRVNGGVRDKSVLVAGGAGAVGHYAIQLARLGGAKQILTTVSGAEKAAVAKSAGADVAINYKSEDVLARVKELTGGRGADRVIEVDIAGNMNLDHQIVCPDGEIVVYGSNAADIAVPFFPMIVKNIGMKFFIVYNLSPQDRTRENRDITEMLERNVLTHNIAARLPLDKIADAHVLVEQGKVIGNVVVSIS